MARQPADNPEVDAPAPPPRGAARTRFLGALALFAVWVAVLVAMAALSAYRPAARSAAVPPADVPADAGGETSPGP
ncbi:MAG: hypothetical protein U0790_25780 [Isosphaeraceae bacterium]